MNVFKIQLGREFSCGGSYFRKTSKGGKIWGRIGDLNSHLGQGPRYPEGAEVVEYELTEVRRISVAQAQNERLTKKKDREISARNFREDKEYAAIKKLTEQFSAKEITLDEFIFACKKLQRGY